EAAGAGVTVDATPSAIADGIARMLREDRTAMAAAGRRHAQEKLSWKEICARLRAAYCRMP
ncbi:MAG TPA: glycosyl transferase family 1, partial [Candidatus Sumerlaeota bacterium]|nr:glycosyl transferase family 1 [Candidatus Sumerlaeota bacterium]